VNLEEKLLTLGGECEAMGGHGGGASSGSVLGPGACTGMGTAAALATGSVTAAQVSSLAM
jgi:hypothetical protein